MAINFKKDRNLNELFEDLFLFIKEHYKPLGILLLNYAAPFILASAIANTVLQSRIANYSVSAGNIMEIYSSLTGSPYYWLALLFSVIGGTVIMGTVFIYIKHYINNKLENIEADSILQELKDNFLMILGTNIVVRLAVGAGILLLIVGAVFLMVALSLTVFIRLEEGKTLSEAMRRSMYLGRNNWWDTAVKMVLIYLTVLLAAYVFSIPVVIMEAISVTKGNSGEVSLMQMIFSGLSMFVSGLLVAIYYIAVPFIYFSLKDRKEANSLNDRLNSIN